VVDFSVRQIDAVQMWLYFYVLFNRMRSGVVKRWGPIFYGNGFSAWLQIRQKDL